MSDITQDAEKIEDIMALADEYAHRRWSAAVSACHFDKLGEKQADADAAEARAALDAAIRQAMGDDAAPTDRIGAALAAPGSERLRDYYATGPVQRASVETFVAALGVPSLQSVASAETCRDAAGVAPAALADANHQCDCSRHPPGSYCDTACTPGVAPSDQGRTKLSDLRGLLRPDQVAPAAPTDTQRLHAILDTFGRREDNMPLTPAERALIGAFDDRGSYTKEMKLDVIDDAVRAAAGVSDPQFDSAVTRLNDRTQAAGEVAQALSDKYGLTLATGVPVAHPTQPEQPR